MRWQMNRLGFVNFWLYDVEEFPLRGGKLLLRGANGAGKSITTQSFIPFILDADRRPQRLDPFGSKDRKMDFYLLGDEEREEATGYLYLEFKKPDVDRYLAIGIGMRAQKNKGITSFWGFCLGDGRRIGHDFMLYTEDKSQRQPLSRLEAKNALGDPANWADTPSEYKKLVNDRIFGFPSLDQYEQFITLLIKIRAPKLSKDFKPSLVQEILNASLSPLTDDDLRAMVDAMEKMDGIQASLEQLEKAQRSAEIIRTEYTRYNQFMLAKKARAYLKRSDETERLHTRVSETQVKIAGLEEQVQAYGEKIREGGETLKRLEAEKSALGGSDTLIEKTERLTKLQAEITQAEADFRSDTQNVLLQREKKNQAENRLQEFSREAESNRIIFRRKIDELDDLGEQLQWPALPTFREQLIQNAEGAHGRANDDDSFARAYSDGRSYGRLLNECHAALLRQDEKNRELSAIQMRLDDADILRDRAKMECEAAYATERGERDRLIEAFLRIKAENHEFILTDGHIEQITRIVSAYDGVGHDSDLNKLLSDIKNERYTPLRISYAECKTDVHKLQEEHATLRQKLKALEDAPESAPPRSASVLETRDELRRRGIVCAPFYELIDFTPEAEQRERDLLEAQLSDMGLLDALVVPREQLPAVADCLARYPDRFFAAQTMAGAGENRPRGLLAADGPLKAAAQEALACLSDTDNGGDTALLPDGRYRIGALRGQSHPTQTAGYIGAAARRENHRRQIDLMKNAIADCGKRLEARNNAFDEIERRIETLDAEYEERPSTADLAAALVLVRDSDSRYLLAKQVSEQLELDEKTARAAFGEAKQQVITCCRDVPLKRTAEAFQDERNALDDFMLLLQELKDAYTGYRRADDLCRTQTEVVEQAEDHLGMLDITARDRQNRIRRLRSEADALTQFLNDPETRALAERLGKLSADIAALARDLPNWQTDANIKEMTLQQEREKVQLQLFDYTAAAEDTQTLLNYFLEEQALGFITDTLSDHPAAAAQLAAKKLRAQDDDQLPDNMRQALQEVFSKNSSELFDYQPKIIPMFDETEGALRRRQLVVMVMDGKQMSLPFFLAEIGKRIVLMRELLNEKDREIFESILTENISVKLRRRIKESDAWTKAMSEIMSGVNTSMGLTFNLAWKGKTEQAEGELGLKQLVELLSKDVEILTDEDRRRITAHFKSKVATARRLATDKDEPAAYADLIRDALDFRNWYEFVLSFRRQGEREKTLTNAEFNKFSGGEKAMAMYVPLFAAISAQYRRAGAECPFIIALDEAFAGVDDRNIESMFKLVETLGFGYIMNSQALWGCYGSVRQLEIADMYRPANSRVVTILFYQWDGVQRALDEGAVLI